MIKGRIIKLLAGFYYVKSNDFVFECKARGVFRNENIKPIVGDMVSVQVDELDETKGYIIEVDERTSELIRPEVANISTVVIVFALKDPKPNIFLLDSLLLNAYHCGIKPILCFNKSDLDKTGELRAQIEEIYKTLDIPLIFTSSLDLNKNVELLKLLDGELSVLAGPSGVGKSTLISQMLGIDLKIGDVSSKIGRGKHTTRHSELIDFEISGIKGTVCDSPGFSSPMDLNIEYREIQNYFPEFIEPKSRCQFSDCLHLNELDCEIINLVNSGVIHKSRYNSYLQLVDIKKNDSKQKNELRIKSEMKSRNKLKMASDIRNNRK